MNSWYREVSRANWQSSAEVKRLYATASIVSADRIVFNVKGNDHRLVVPVSYRKGIVWIVWIGNHAEYDKIDARSVRHVKT